MEHIRILTCKAMTTGEIWVRILIFNDCGTEKFLNVFFPVEVYSEKYIKYIIEARYFSFMRRHKFARVSWINWNLPVTSREKYS